MRDYAKVAPQFWTGTTGKALKLAGAEAVIVGMYLMTSPHANMIGVYHCPVGYISIDTGLTFEGASKGLRSAIEADFCTYDEASGYVFVHEFAAYQIGDELDPKDKRCAGVRNELAKVPKNQCWQGFRARYAEPFHLPSLTQVPSPMDAPSKPLRSQEQEQKQKKEIGGLESEGGTKVKSRSQKRPLPDDWMPADSTVSSLSSQVAVSPSVLRGAYVEAFRDACKAKGYTYLDFEAAFRNCVRQDWPKLRAKGVNGHPAAGDMFRERGL